MDNVIQSEWAKNNDKVILSYFWSTLAFMLVFFGVFLALVVKMFEYAKYVDGKLG